MTWLISSLSYTTAALIIARLIAGHLAWTWNERERLVDKTRWPHVHNPNQFLSPAGELWFGAWCLALLVVIVWPLVAVPWLTGRRWSIGAEQEQRLRLREEHVRKLEKELNLD